MEETGTGEASDPTQEGVGGTLNGSQLQLHSFGAGLAGTVDSCLNGRCGSNKKRSRSAPWTVYEMLTLIEAKKEERERCQVYKNQGVKLPAAEKWRVVAMHMESKEMARSGSQCQDKWENMMKDYKSVREWQYVNNGAKDYFKDMMNKERKDASLPPQMDEIVYYSLHAIQNEKEEKKDRMKWKEREQFKNHVSSSNPIVIKEKVGSSEGDDMESFDTDSSGKRRRSKRLQQEQQLPMRVGSDQNPVVLNDFVHAMKDGSKELIDCFMKALERSDRRQEAVETESTTPKDTATLARVLVALADAVKTVAQTL